MHHYLFSIDGLHISRIGQLLVMADNSKRMTTGALVLGVVTDLPPIRDLVGEAAAGDEDSPES